MVIIFFFSFFFFFILRNPNCSCIKQHNLTCDIRSLLPPRHQPVNRSVLCMLITFQSILSWCCLGCWAMSPIPAGAEDNFILGSDELALLRAAVQLNRKTRHTLLWNYSPVTPQNTAGSFSQTMVVALGHREVLTTTR